MAQPGSAFALGAKGPEFESQHPDYPSTVKFSVLFSPSQFPGHPFFLQDSSEVYLMTFAGGEQTSQVLTRRRVRP